MRNCHRGNHPEIRDYGSGPFVFNINHAANMNQNFRTTLWTGRDMQLTLMNIPVKSDIGTEMHANVDQFIRIENGRAKVYMGNCENTLREVQTVNGNYAVIVPITQKRRHHEPDHRKNNIEISHLLFSGN